MKIKDMPVKVGQRAIDDTRRIDLPGTLIKPDSRSEILLILQCGITGSTQDYVEYFAKELGYIFNVYVSELRKKGFCLASKCIDDFKQVDNSLRDIVEPEFVYYFGHSMGMPITVASMNKYDSQVVGLYGISTYPSIGDRMIKDADVDHSSLLEKMLNAFSRTNYSLLAYPLKDSEIEVPIRFAIAEQDEFLNTAKPKVRERFINRFAKYTRSSSRVFQRRNHCFNYKKWDLKPFNRDEPRVLLEDIMEFVSNTATSKL